MGVIWVPLAFRQCSEPWDCRAADHSFQFAFFMDEECRNKYGFPIYRGRLFPSLHEFRADTCVLTFAWDVVYSDIRFDRPVVTATSAQNPALAARQWHPEQIEPI